MIILTLKDKEYDLRLQEPTKEELELDFIRQDFEYEWQNAFTREELTNFIIFGIKSYPAKLKWINFGQYDIKNQAREMGDICQCQKP